MTYRTYDGKQHTIRGCPQFEFLNSLAETTAFFGANRCLGGETKIYDPLSDELKRIDEIKDSFHVLAWDGERLVKTQALKPFRKDIDDLFEVTLANGGKFICSKSHEILTPDGWRSLSQLRVLDSVFQTPTSSEFYQLTHALNERRYLKKVGGSKAYYRFLPDFYDEQPLAERDIFQDVFPLPADVQERIFGEGYGRKDDLDNKLKRNHPYQSIVHRTIRDALHRCAVRVFDILYHVFYTLYKSNVGQRIKWLRSSLAFFLRKSIDVFYQSDRTYDSTIPYAYSSYSVIISIEFKRRDVKWDFTVPQYHNYFCGGTLHHNSGKSVSGAVKSIIHATGRYPEWWTAKRYYRPTVGRVFAKDFQKGAAVVIKKLHQWMPRDAITQIRKGNMGVEVYWHIKHTSGGTSFFDIMTYEQDPFSAEGWDGDWVWFDEPPPRDMYIAAVRGLVDNEGLCWFSLTPLKEPWLFDEIYCSKNKNVFSVICDMRHNLERVNPLSGQLVGLKEEAIRKFEMKLTEEERETRAHGKFRYLAGRIWKEWDRDVHTFDRNKEWKKGKTPGVLFDGEPPAHWPRAMFMDPHDRLPHAVLWVACDEAGDYWAYREGWLADYLLEEAAAYMKKVEMLVRERIQVRFLDPNFGPKKYANTGDTVRDELEKAGKNIGYPLRFVFANDSKEMGRKEFGALLKFDHTRPLSLINHPKFRAANDLKEFVYQIEHYVWDDFKSAYDRDPKEKPKPINTHFPDLCHYLALSKFQLYKPVITEGRGNFYAGNKG